MEAPCIKAYHEEEERYSRLILEYHNTKQRKKICKKVSNMIEKYHIVPFTTVTPKDGKNGEYSLEFHDDYDRKSGDFFEDLIHSLGVEHCEME